jgi:hypothetical protein
MNRLEKDSLKHAAEWLRYSRSPQALLDAEQDRLRRIEGDKKAGHSPLCSLTKCHPSCGRV